MNIGLLKKHIEQNTKFSFPELKADGSNANEFFCADIVGARRFAQNYGGYPRSEIAQINEAASLEEQMNIMQTLNDYSPANNPNAGLTDAEIMLGHKSKYLQAASEQIAWLDAQLERRDNERFLAQQKDSAKDPKDMSNVVEQNADPE